MMRDNRQWRLRARTALQNYFQKRSAPRLILTVLLIITGLAGLIVSFVLLRSGLEQMWIRYPIAVFAGYGVFLGLIRLWVELEKSRFNPDLREIEEPLKASDYRPFEPTWRSGHGEGSWFDWLDIPSAFDLDEGCLPVLLIGALIGLLAVLAYAVMAAPALLAEVFIDAFIVSVLYRHLRIAAEGNWLGTAVRKTWLLAFAAAALLCLAGWCLEMLAPGTHSIGPAIEKLLHS
jgi:hypothetical protein